MKKSLFFLLLLLCGAATGFSQSGWYQWSDSATQSSFKFPVTPIITDTLHTTMYNGSVDSLLGIQVHLFDSACFDATEPLLAQALSANSGDTLRAIAQLALLTTQATLFALADVLTDDRSGLELGLEFSELQSNIPTLTFMRYFILGNRFLCFSITGSKDDLPRFLSYKETFFNAINFD